VGCADALKIDKHWSNLVASSQLRRRYFKDNQLQVVSIKLQPGDQRSFCISTRCK
jgi:hypothetical protein